MEPRSGRGRAAQPVAESSDSATATNPGQYDGSAQPQPGHTLDLASAALDELKGQTNWRQARLEVASAGDEPCSKRTTQSGKRGCRLLITRQAGCCTRPDLWLCVGAPRRRGVGWREVACSAVSGKSLARALHGSPCHGRRRHRPEPCPQPTGTSGAVLSQKKWVEGTARGNETKAGQEMLGPGAVI